MDQAYRRLCSRLGAAMLCHHVLINVLFVGVISVVTIMAAALDDRTYNLIYQITYNALYLAVFMLPVAFFRFLDRDTPRQPMELAPQMRWRALLFIFATLGVNLPCAYFNGYFMQLLEAIGISDMVSMVDMAVFVYPEDYVLMHMSLALVPAFCEEFLFRGLICRRLMPYGKTVAVLGSALLFGLMHGNLSQLFYTTMAGVMLGWCYVETRSIWPGVIAHMLNNLTAYLTEVFYDRLSPDHAALCDTLLNGAIVLIGLVCLICILRTRRENTPLLGLGNTRPLDGTETEILSPAACVRGFFRPTMAVYVALAVVGIFGYLALGSLMDIFDLEGLY